MLYGPFSQNVRIVGHDPSYVLATKLSGYNWFLVKGYYIEDRNDEKKNEESIPYFYIEDWDVVSPVKRLGENIWESNFRGFDKDDLEKGDYLVNVDKNRVGLRWPDMFMESGCILAGVKKVNGDIRWYRYASFFDKEPTEEITVLEKTPQNYLSETFLHENNKFVLIGKYEEGTSAFICSEWTFYSLVRQYGDDRIENTYGNKKGYAFTRDEKGELRHSAFYFDAQDIENGDYFPNGDSPLGRQDGLE